MGKREGCGDGTGVGTLDGVGDGLGVGNIVGSGVGSLEGGGVGKREGCGDGTGVSTLDGVGDGLGVGNIVGTARILKKLKAGNPSIRKVTTTLFIVCPIENTDLAHHGELLLSTSHPSPSKSAPPTAVKNTLVP